MANQLIHETSPYLLKHAHNPVDWWPWCQDAFDKAKLENKPIFVSIGYFSCHWCSVMELESFSDPSTAKIMNDFFISIKVDREELPDIDHQYQLVYQVMNGRGGGWPLSVFMTADKVPFFTGTYFPPTRRFNMPAFKDVLLQIAKTYQSSYAQIDRTKASISKHLQDIQTRIQDSVQYSKPNFVIVEQSASDLASEYDQQFGGFGSAPKFPHESSLAFLLSEGIRQQKRLYVKIVMYTLEVMCNGGIYDQLGGGFHRYSVDDQWLVPHFEKMLYTQAQMADVLLDTYQITGNTHFRDIAQEVLDYTIRELGNPKGGFYSGADADSEGKEGKFYIWSYQEVFDVLGKDLGDIFCEYYGISKRGNWEGVNILTINSSMSKIAKKYKRTESDILQDLKAAKSKLFQYRQKRIPPGIDNKVLTGWSSLMIKPLIRMAWILGGNSELGLKYSHTALKTLDFLLEYMYKDFILYRVFKEDSTGETIKIPGFLEDYVYCAMAMLDGFEYSLNIRYLNCALELASVLITDFWDNSNSGMFFSTSQHDTPMNRFKDVFDSPLPSPNSVSVILFNRLYFFTEDSKWIDYSEKILKCFSAAANQGSGLGMSTYYQALVWHLSHNTELIILDGKNDTEAEFSLCSQLQRMWIPNRVQLKVSADFSNLPYELHERSWRLGKSLSVDGQTTAYICQNFSCSLPLISIKDIKIYLNDNRIYPILIE